MNLLLDTHIALWAVSDHRRLPHAARALVADTTNTIAVSVAALWEIAVKHARKGSAEMPVSAREAEAKFSEAGFAMLPISKAHALAVERLPDIHGDPFDRILIAQALTEPLRLVTSDKVVASYDASILLV